MQDAGLTIITRCARHQMPHVWQLLAHSLVDSVLGEARAAEVIDVILLSVRDPESQS